MSAALSLPTTSRPWTLADFLSRAGIQELPEWAPQVTLSDPPFPHQIEDLHHFAKFIRRGLWSEPGTGKTYSSQAYLIWSASLGNKGLVIVPPTLVTQFEAEFAKFQGLGRHLKVSVFRGDLEYRTGLIQLWDRVGWPDILITSYRMFVGVEEQKVAQRYATNARKALRNGKTPKPQVTKEECPAAYWTWRDFLDRGYNDLVIDEATAVKHPTSGLYKAVKEFLGPYTEEESNGVLLITGTPIENRLEDTYGLISLVNPLKYKSFRAFQRFHCIVNGNEHGKVITYINREHLTDALYEAGRRVLKQDVLKDLPPLMVSEIQVDLEPSHQALYKKLVKERILELGDKVIDATTASSLRQKVQQIIMSPELFSEHKWEKNALVDTIDQVVAIINPGVRKVLVFAYYQKSIEKLRAHYGRYNPAVLYGQSGNRDAQIEKFKTDPTCRMMIAQHRSGGYGLNLQDVCSHVVVAEMLSVPGTLQQMCDRTHRAGQTQPVTLYLLVVLRTVSVSIRNDLVRKAGEARDVTKDARATLRDLMGEDGIQGRLG